MRYFIYCRKSSEAEDRQVASIESQLSTLQRTFAGRPDIEIVAIFQEAFSAKAPGRTEFGKMLSAIERREADGIVAWAPDRLARNSIDGGRLIYMLDCGVIRDLKFATYTFENNSQGKFMLQIMFGQSKYYSDALSDNVKRGNRSKAERGWRPNLAPLGYMNDAQTRTIVCDPERFPLIQKMFELMLTGTYSPRRICQIARNQWGFRTPKRKRIGGKPIALSSVYKILTNPFYAGILIWAGKTYKGAHEPAVTIAEFEQVQTLLGRGEKPRPKRLQFAFTGIVRCGECGLLVTAEHKVNRHGSRYTYYHCSKRKFDYKCRQRSITDQHLEDQIHAFINSVAVPNRIHLWARKQFEASVAQRAKLAETRRQSLQQALADAGTAIANLTSLRIRDLIDDNEYIKERGALERDRLRLQQELQTGAEPDSAFEPFDAIVSFNDRASDWFQNGDADVKRLILESVGSNPILKDKLLSVEAKKPFRIVSKAVTRPQLRAAVEDIRTLYTQKDPELLLILDNIKKIEAKFGTQSSVDDHRVCRAA